MNKKYIVQFLKEKKRGVYTVIVEVYSDVINTMAVTMALDIIKQDLEKESGESVDLNYFSLAKATLKFKKASSTRSGKEKWNFKDDHEMEERQSAPGTFKVSQSS